MYSAGRWTGILVYSWNVQQCLYLRIQLLHIDFMQSMHYLIYALYTTLLLDSINCPLDTELWVTYDLLLDMTLNTLSFCCYHIHAYSNLLYLFSAVGIQLTLQIEPNLNCSRQALVKRLFDIGLNNHFSFLAAKISKSWNIFTYYESYS